MKDAHPTPRKKIDIPLSERETLRLLGKVKCAADMPHPGANPTTAKKKSANKRKSKPA